MPDGILEPQIIRIEAGGGGEMSFIAAQTTDMTLEQLSWYIDNTVSRRLLGVPGLAAVTREGGVDRQIRIELDPAALQSQGITAAQVNQQLRQVNVNATGGRAEIAGSEQTVRVLGNAKDAYALSQTQIAVPGGRTVKLDDLGDVRDSNSEVRSAAYLGGRTVVSFNLQRARGASEVTVYDAAWEELRKIEKEDPRIKFVEIDNTVDYTKDQYASSMRALVEGAVLAVFVVFLFLRDFRATIISAVAIPLSAIPAFWFMDLMDINLNFLSLLALALVAGVLVDDAIVEIENIVRHMRMGKSAYQASIDAADEIGLAVLATTMSIVARVPAGRADARHFRPVLPPLRLYGRAVGGDEPARRANDHAADGGLFPQVARAGTARLGPMDDGLSRAAELDLVRRQGEAAARRICRARKAVRSTM